MDMLAKALVAMQQSFFMATLLFVLFGALGWLMPCNPDQKMLHRGMLTNAGYYFILPLFTQLVQSLYIIAGAQLLFYGEIGDAQMRHVMEGFGPLGTLPLWAQAAIAFILSDIILYWMHRWFHTAKMWPFHAIHHSSTQVDWHSTYRFHPINIWLSFTLVNALMVCIGLSIQSIMIMATFNTLYSAMVHANLNWTFGPFKYLFSSPVFHRWHHTVQAEGLNKNFAPTFPLLDIIFGTFYMPEGEVPTHYGITGTTLPESFWQQMLWPFRQK